MRGAGGAKAEVITWKIILSEVVIIVFQNGK